MTRLPLAALAALSLTLAGCGDKLQSAGSKKGDAQPWEGAQASFTEKGWKAGDQASWEAQMRARAQSQNEYTRTPPATK